MSMSDQMKQEVKMRLREKIGIFVLAVLLTFAAFSIIAAPAVDIMKVGKFAGYEIISNVLARANSPLVQSITRKG
jgi:heme/copper-type cytochrome/quinol oxidase subunit 4